MSHDYDSVAAMLREPDPESRRLATQQLARVRGNDLAELLVRALADEDWRVRKEAAAVAPALEPREAVILAVSAALDEKENIGLRNAAVEALIAIGNDAVPSAIVALGSLDADGRKLAVEILGGVPDARGTRALVSALQDEDGNVRGAAAEALGSAGLAGAEARALALGALSTVLSTTEVLLKLAALDSLARLDAKIAWPVFEPLFGDPVLRRHAIAAAGRSHEKAAIVALAGAIGDTSVAVSRDALVALVDSLLAAPQRDELFAIARSRIAADSRAPRRIRSFAGADEDAKVRGAALVALGVLRQTEDVRTLLDGLSDEEQGSRAELALRIFGREALGPLLEQSQESMPPVRAATISLVPILAEVSDRPTLEVLHHALHDPSADVAVAAIKAIAATGGAADLARLAPHTHHSDPRIASVATSALGSLAARHPKEARALLLTIDTSGADAVVGCVIVGAIAEGGFSRAAESDVVFLQSALAHGDAHVRRAAVDALAAIGGAVAGDAVGFALADEEREVVLAAIRALGRMGRAEPLMTLLEGTRDGGIVACALRALSEADPEHAFEAARPLVRRSDPVVACAAVEAIGQLRGPRREDGLFVALEHAEPDVVKAALVELARDLDARSTARLGLCLDHESWDVRRLAAELLGVGGRAAARPLLRARLERETNAAVRDALHEALSARTTPPRET
jgi:HEAT repeat protein